MAACAALLVFVFLQVFHEVITFVLGDLTGLTSVGVRVVVGGQSSNTLVVPVRAPTVDSLDVYDVALLVSTEHWIDSC